MPGTAESDRTTGFVANNPGFGCGRIVNWKTDSPKRILGHVRIFWSSILQVRRGV